MRLNDGVVIETHGKPYFIAELNTSHFGNVETAKEMIDAAREALFMEPFALHHEFLAARGPVSAQAVGEPKQAQAWLARADLAGL